jgi:hypothetical protein
MADALYYIIGIGLVAMAAITAWIVTTPDMHLYVG